MKICQNCGIALPDAAAFCTTCGAAVMSAPSPVTPVEETPAPETIPQPVYVPPVYVPTVTPVQPMTPPAESKKEAVSVGGWMGRDLLPFIPVAGPIIYFIMLWVWSFNQSKEESFRNWAKSRLIWMAIAAGLSLVTVVIMLALGVSFAEAFYNSSYF